MNRVVEYIIRAKDATAGVLKSAMSHVADFASGVERRLAAIRRGASSFLSGAAQKVKGFASAVGRNLVNIQAGFTMLASAARKALSLMSKSFEFERMTYQFKTLLGNIDDARVHMQMLQRMGDTPPFSLEEFAKASRELMKFSDGVLGFRDSLTLVGDAAAALGVPVDQLANMVGRAYAQIRDGQPIERAGMMLKNVGAISPEVMARLKDMSAAGASNIEIWNELERELGRFQGAMKDTESTGAGLMGAIEAQWDDSVREFGAAFMDSAKGGLQLVLDKMKELNENGDIAAWAESVSQSMSSLVAKLRETVEALSAVGSAVGWLYEKAGISDLWHGTVSIAKGFGSGIGAAVGTWQGGGSFLEGLSDYGKEYDRASMEEIAKGYYGNKLMAAGMFGDEGKDIAEREAQTGAEAAEKVEQARSSARERHIAERQEAEEKAAKMEAEKREKLEAEMAEKQYQQDVERYNKELEEYYKLCEEEEAERQRMLEAIAREEAEAERKRHQQALANAQDEAAAGERAQGEAQQRLAAAQAQVARAWGWYKDKASMQGEIDAYREQQEAEKQWEKDFQKLKDKRRDWRDVEFGKLSAEEEAVRQVALAKEEERAAQVALDEIAENTAYLKEIAESLASEEGA